MRKKGKERWACRPSYQKVDYSDLDADWYVAQRRLPQLTALRDRALDALQAAQKGVPPRDTESVQLEVNEAVFTWVLDKTGHKDLAAQLADDHRLIRGAYWNAVPDDPYINALVDVYREGRLPLPEDFGE